MPVIFLAALAALALMMASKPAAAPAQAPVSDTLPPPSQDDAPEPDVNPPRERTSAYNGFLGAYARTPYHNAIAAAEADNGIPENLYARQLYAESGFDPGAVSPAGAKGIAQFMDATAEDYQIDAMNPDEAIPAGASYLAWLQRETGDWYAALVAYNWGIGRVQRQGVDKAPAISQNYANGILADSELQA